MTVVHKSFSICGHKTASKHEGLKFSSTSRLANYDGVTVQKPSNGITASDLILSDLSLSDLTPSDPTHLT
jgi:hypothetical protein